jgi:HPt (histidine-containing phosphotransfer) domain-containing protein
MSQTTGGVVNWASFAETRAVIGSDFVRILGYYREDSAKNVVAIEQAFRARDAVAMVRPAHTLKGDSLQFGGQAIGQLAERIEHVARNCVESHKTPDELAIDIPRLRPLLIETLGAFEQEIARTAAAQSRMAPPVAAGGFGRKRA